LLESDWHTFSCVAINKFGVRILFMPFFELSEQVMCLMPESPMLLGLSNRCYFGMVHNNQEDTHV